MSNIIIAILALAVFAIAEGLYYFVSYLGEQSREDLRRRLQEVTHAGTETSLLRERKMAKTPGLTQLFDSISWARSLEKVLLQTDMQVTVAMIVTIGLGIGVALSMLFVAILARPAWLMILLMPAGVMIPVLHVMGVRTRRSRKISEQLPDALEMMIRSLQAGHSVGSGFKLVSQEMGAPIAVEFARCFEEQNAGVTLRDSISHMTERVPDNLDLKIFAVSVVIQHETGGNLIEILEKISGTVRERFKFYGKLRALTAEAKLSGIVLGALPIFCAMLMLAFRPTYLVPMFKDIIGILIFGGGVIAWLFGAFWMSKLSKVDF